jgi:hypothetical protein
MFNNNSSLIVFKYFCNDFKVPALLENKVKGQICSDSEDPGHSECSDTDTEEQGDHAHCRKHTTDPNIDKKVGQDFSMIAATLVSLCLRDRAVAVSASI